jgi:plastocyanin
MLRLRNVLRPAAILVLAVLAAACSRDRPAKDPAHRPNAQPATGEVPSTGGHVHEVRITHGTDGAAAFAPARVTARQGDVLRFVRGDADGGVAFPRRPNPAGALLPSPSPLMRQPGQVYEVPVDLPPGTYTFVSLPPGPGVGTLEVVP